MPIEVSKLPDEPIVIAAFAEPVNFREEIPPALERIVALRDTITEPSSCYYVILDVSGYTLAFGDVVFGLGELRGVKSWRRDDLPARMLVVGAGGLIDLAAKAMRQLQYGAYQSRLFDSLDEAISAARAEAAHESARRLPADEAG